MRLDTPHQLVTLAGGTRLLTAPMPDRSSVSMVLMFGVGSRYEDDRVSGVSHFIEHLFFKGTGKRPTAKEIAEAIEGVGGVMNASTDKELTVYWTRVPSERLELALDVLFDIVTDSRLVSDDIDRERLVILQELKMYHDQPQDYVHSIFERLMWPRHPLGRDIVGTQDSIRSMSRDDLVAYIHSHYRGPNLVVGVAGDLDPGHTVDLVRSHLRLPEQPNGLARPGSPPPLAGPGVQVEYRKTEQAHICLGTRGVSYLDPDRYTLDLVNTILGEGMSSRLFLEIRERRSLAYDVHSYTSKHHDVGYFAVYLGVDPKKAHDAVEAVVAELHKLADSPVADIELNKAKEFTKGRLRLGLESTNAVASWLTQQLLLTGRIRSVEEVVALVDAVRPEDIQRVAGRVLKSAIQLAVVGPYESDAGFSGTIGA